MSPEPLVALPVVDFAPFLDGCADPVVIGVACDGSAYAVARKARKPPKVTGKLANTRLRRPTDYLVIRHGTGVTESFVVPRQTMVFHHVQPHPDGALLVCARCWWTPQAVDENALVVDRTGRAVRRFTLGDGIEDVRVTPNGTVWVSYFDEGIFGNYGWNHPGPRAIGAPGLVAFTRTGKLVRSYDAKTAGTDAICDAYATNVVGDDEAWVYFYTEFSIVRLRGKRYSVWRTRHGGARALCVRGNRALLVGGYDDSLVRCLELGKNGKTRTLWKRPLVDERGRRLDDVWCRGVGDRLYVFKGRAVSRVAEW